MDKHTLDTNSRSKSRNFMLLWGTLFILVMTDGLISQYLITHGIAWELNPFLASLIDEKVFLLVKAAGVLIAIIILWDISKRHYRIALAVSNFFVIFYTVIVFWNTYLFIVN